MVWMGCFKGAAHHMACPIAWIFHQFEGCSMGVTVDVCLFCLEPGENIKHLFFECAELQLCWNIVAALVSHSPLQSLV